MPDFFNLVNGIDDNELAQKSLPVKAEINHYTRQRKNKFMGFDFF